MSNILVVEDAIASRTIVETGLQSHGYRVDAFESPLWALSQAIHAVLVNAIKYSPPQGRIVSGFRHTRDSQDHLNISVSNRARAAQAVDW